MVHALFDNWFCTNIGIATGDGLVVVDCDSREAETAFLDEFDIPETYCVSTRQGTHFYFTCDPLVRFKTVTAWRPGIDIRATAGLVVAAGSTHVSGYVYQNCPESSETPAQLPLSLQNALPLAHIRQSGSGLECKFSEVEMPGAESTLEAVYFRPARELPAGSRNSELFRLACRLYEGVWIGLFAPARMDQLAQEAEISGLTSWEIRRTIKSAMERIQNEHS